MCISNLRTDLSPTSDPGGQWFYLGYSTDPAGPFGSGGNLVNTPIFGVVPGGDNPPVDPSGATDGFYRFRYTVGISPCSSFNTLDVEVLNGICAGGDNTLIRCNNTATGTEVFDIPLTTLFDSPNCSVVLGTIETLSSPNAVPAVFSGSGQDLKFDVSANPIGDYVITNTHPQAPEYTDFCEECSPTSTLNLELREGDPQIEESTPPIIELTCDPNIPGDCEFNLQDFVVFNSPTDTNPQALAGTWVFEGKITTDGINTSGGVDSTFKFTGAGVPTAQNGLFLDYGLSTFQNISDRDIDVVVDFSQALEDTGFRFQYQVYYNNFSAETCAQDFFIDVRVSFGCNITCDQGFQTGEYVQNLNSSSLFAEYQTDPVEVDALVSSYAVRSFIIDGVELVPSPISYGPADFADLGGNPYLENPYKTLQTISTPGITFGLTASTDDSGVARYIYMFVSDRCLDWSFVLGSDSPSTWMRYTFDSIEYFNDGTDYVFQSDPIVNGTSPSWTPIINNYLNPPIQNFSQPEC